MKTTDDMLTEERIREIAVIHIGMDYDRVPHSVIECVRCAIREAGAEMTDAMRDVLAERRRQIDKEGWAPKHDDEYRDHEMSSAAGCYAMYTLAFPAGDPPPAWPWDAAWWKPTTHRRNLEKAAALILAEMEKIDRATARAGDSQ